MQLAPSALHTTAETLTRSLGAGTWQVDELITDGIVTFEGPHDRQIGMRLIGDGSNIQLWATGGTQPAGHEPIEGIAPLPHGHRWHTPVHIGALEPDKDPGVVLYNAISRRLLPVFDTKPLYVGRGLRQRTVRGDGRVDTGGRHLPVRLRAGSAHPAAGHW
ncbi:hypothetical protein ACWEP4_09280 [Streptomyces sp. NPDC004227]